MGLDALLKRMQSGESVTPVTPCYPDGVTAKAAPDKACTLVTPQIININTENESPGLQEQANLARLVARVCRYYDCTGSEIAEAIERAQADYHDALTCYTSLAMKAGMARGNVWR